MKVKAVLLLLCDCRHVRAGDWNLQWAAILEDCTNGEPVSYHISTSPYDVNPEDFTCLNPGKYPYPSCVPFGSGDSCPTTPWWGVKLPLAKKATCAFVEQHGNPRWTCLKLSVATSEDGENWTPVNVSNDGTIWSDDLEAAACPCPSRMCDVSSLGVNPKPGSVSWSYSGGILFHMDVGKPQQFYKIECSSDTFDQSCTAERGCAPAPPPPDAVPSDVPSVNAVAYMDVFRDAACKEVNEAQPLIEFNQDGIDAMCWSWSDALAFKAFLRSDGQVGVNLYQPESGGSLSCTGETYEFVTYGYAQSFAYFSDKACTGFAGLYGKLREPLPHGSFPILAEGASAPAVAYMDIFQDAACTEVNEAQPLIIFNQDGSDAMCWRFASSIAFKAFLRSDGQVGVNLYQPPDASLSCTGETSEFVTYSEAEAFAYFSDRACTEFAGLYGKLREPLPYGSFPSRSEDVSAPTRKKNARKRRDKRRKTKGSTKMTTKAGKKRQNKNKRKAKAGKSKKV